MITHYLLTMLYAASAPPVVVAPSVMTLQLVKQHLEYEDSDRDALILTYMGAAKSWVEKFTGKAITNKAAVETFDHFGSFIDLANSPVLSIATIEYLDAAALPQNVTGFRFRGDRIYPPKAGWPAIAEYSTIKVTYQAGYAETPPDLISAQLLLIGHFFENREAATDRPAQAIDMAVDALCSPYRELRV